MGDILRYDTVLKLRVTEAFTKLQYDKDRTYAERRQREYESKINKQKKQ